jgi:hypothetical protein
VFGSTNIPSANYCACNGMVIGSLSVTLHEALNTSGSGGCSLASLERLQRRVGSNLERRRRIRSSRQILTMAMQWSWTKRHFKDLDVRMRPALKVKDVELGVAGKQEAFSK